MITIKLIKNSFGQLLCVRQMKKISIELSGSYQGPGTMPDNVSDLLTRAQLDNARDVYKLIESRSELNPIKIVSWQ